MMSPRESVGKPQYRELIAERRRNLVAQTTAILAGARSPVLEIGSGHGHFLTAFAEKHPDRLCVGIDLMGERVARARRKQQRSGLLNLHFVRADLSLFLECVPPGTRWREVFVLFPDPWPKVRHHKHRIIQIENLKTIADHSDPSCRFYFRTDFLPYFEASTAVFSGSDHWVLVAEPWPFECETVFQRRAVNHHSLVAKRRA